ncbi:MAG: hypothetical protein WCN98_13180 [Verrucomicrobiaceae bacterium]
MKDKQRFQLIDGTFTPSDAAQVLLSLVKSKISFHDIQLFSNKERYGRDVDHSEKRLAKLKQLEASLKDILESAARSNHTLKVDGWIEISSCGAD